MTSITTLARIHKLEERYPFNEEELEILARCHDHLEDLQNPDNFLMTLAKALPYTVFFLPHDEVRDRVNWIEDNVLPPGFSSRLRSALSADPFVEYANQGEDKSLERFIEGIADTGRRGSKEALHMIYAILDEDASPEGLVELCVYLAIAADVLVIPTLNKDLTLLRLKHATSCIVSLSKSLNDFCKNDKLSKNTFVEWAESNFPMLASTLMTFVHNLLFHGQKYPPGRIPYTSPCVYDSSDIFTSDNSALLIELSFTGNLGGKWERLYSSERDGRSFNRLEWALLGYTGPTATVVKTTNGAIIGAKTEMPWKESSHFYGGTEGYLFQLVPQLAVYRPQGLERNFAYLHTSHKSTLMPDLDHNLPSGLGFGGSMDQPRLFIPESFEHCKAGFLDSTYMPGNLLPLSALERFEIYCVEVWGVGGDEIIKRAIHDRAEYRERHEMFRQEARTVLDKTQFAMDLESGLIPSSIFEHRKDSRGRHDFVVDDEHSGAYKVERE